MSSLNLFVRTFARILIGFLLSVLAISVAITPYCDRVSGSPAQVAGQLACCIVMSPILGVVGLRMMTRRPMGSQAA